MWKGLYPRFAPIGAMSQCEKESMSDSYQKHVHRLHDYSKRKVCSDCGHPIDEVGYATCSRCRAEGRKYTRKRRLNPDRLNNEKRRARERYYELKGKIISHYGGKCVCCGETHPEFLNLHHLNMDGKKQIMEAFKVNYRPVHAFYKLIIRNKYPKDLVLLCWNCHQATHAYGICPHAVERASLK